MAKASTKAPEQTGAEPKYLRQLIEAKTPIQIKLEDDSVVSGTLEYYDVAFLRLTREDAPNLFIFKDDIKYVMDPTPAAAAHEADDE